MTTLAKTSPARWDLETEPPSLIGLKGEIRHDRESFKLIAGQLLPRVRNLIRYLVRGDQDVDDIAQEALLAVLRGLSSYRGEGSIESWADRVVARVTFGWIRRHRSRSTLCLDVEDDGGADRSAMPDEYLRRRHLVALLDRLPHEQHQALVLRHVLGLSVSEIALETASKTETVRTRLRLGKQHLRELAKLDSTEAEATDDLP